MFSKIVILVSCLYLAQASVGEEPDQQFDGVTNYAEAVLSRSRRSCGAGECNAHCIKLGHKRGVCIGTYCQCRSRLRRSADEDTEDSQQVFNVISEAVEHEQSDVAIPDVGSDSEVKSRSTRGTCSYDGCNSFCRKLGHARGVCIGTYCQCRFRRRRSVPQEIDSVSNSVEAVLSRSRRSCGAGECNAHCIKLGHKRGVCIGTYCQCRSL